MAHPLDAPALHTCTHCGKVAPWGPTWRWFSDGFDKSRSPWWAGDPVCKWKACSFECARAIDPKAPTDEELARQEQRFEARVNAILAGKDHGCDDDWSGVTGQAAEQAAPPRRRKTKADLERELAEARRRIAELEAER